MAGSVLLVARTGSDALAVMALGANSNAFAYSTENMTIENNRAYM